MLTFVEEDHAYFWSGVRVPNVTSVLGDLTDLSMVPPSKLAVAREKGLAVHKMVELDANNKLESVPEWMESILVEWRKFVSQFGFKVIDSEKRVFHPTYRYAGTMDLYGESNSGPVYVDVKRSFLGGASIGYQLAAYQAADAHANKERRKAKRFALRLKEGEPYRMAEYPDANDLSVFLACLTVYRVKQKIHAPQYA